MYSCGLLRVLNPLFVACPRFIYPRHVCLPTLLQILIRRCASQMQVQSKTEPRCRRAECSNMRLVQAKVPQATTGVRGRGSEMTGSQHLSSTPTCACCDEPIPALYPELSLPLASMWALPSPASRREFAAAYCFQEGRARYSITIKMKSYEKLLSFLEDVEVSMRNNECKRDKQLYRGAHAIPCSVG